MRFRRENLAASGYDEVVYAEEPKSGLRGIIAIHSTALGPSCGGIRMLPYVSREEALNDVLRLAKGMSYKSALAGIGFGGGKSVILGDPKSKSPALFHAFGELVESLGGRYIAAKDMNITSPDLVEVRKTTRHVLGIDGVPGSSGDPSPVTARGVFRALEATWEEISGSRSLKGIRVAIQGIGQVGFDVAARVKEAGGSVWVTDVDPGSLERARKELGATVIAPEAIYDVECDIFSPSARGAVLNAETIPRLRCQAIVGCANNQLATPQDGLRLAERGILYAPDFAVNAGGIINIFVEYEGYNASRAFAKADGIYDTLKLIFRRAKSERKPPFEVADRIAEERLRGGR